MIKSLELQFNHSDSSEKILSKVLMCLSKNNINLLWKIYNFKSGENIDFYLKKVTGVPNYDESLTIYNKPIDEIFTGYNMSWQEVLDLDSMVKNYDWLLLIGYDATWKAKISIEYIDASAMHIETNNPEVFDLLKKEFPVMIEMHPSQKNIW